MSLSNFYDSLVGRRSSVLKMKPSPPVHETISLKRPRSTLRVGTSKKKVLMDDMMVLHGEYVSYASICLYIYLILYLSCTLFHKFSLFIF